MRFARTEQCPRCGEQLDLHEMSHAPGAVAAARPEWFLVCRSCKADLREEVERGMWS